MPNLDRLLPYIPGPLLAAAGRALPDANGCTDPAREVQLLVTIRYERKDNHKRDKSYFWTACEADVKVQGEDGWIAPEPTQGASSTSGFLK